VARSGNGGRISRGDSGPSECREIHRSEEAGYLTLPGHPSAFGAFVRQKQEPGMTVSALAQAAW
jgi:hypothetical protein